METTSLKALARKVLERNQAGNQKETETKKQGNFCVKNGGKSFPKVSLLSHPEKYQNMTLDDFEKENTLIKVYSKILDENIYFASNDETVFRCGTLAGVIYTTNELRELIRKKVPEKELRLLHTAKKEFNGKIINES